MIIYIEYLCIRNLITIIFYLNKRKINYFKNNKFFYIDTDFKTTIFLKFLQFFIPFKFNKMSFKLSDIISIDDKKNKELVKLRLERKDLFEIQERILNTREFKRIIPNLDKNKFFHDYIRKSLTDGHIIMEPESLNRAIFIINVVKHYNSSNLSSILFFIGKRPWWNEIQEYSKSKNLINIQAIPVIKKFNKKLFNINFFTKFKKTYFFINSIYLIKILKKFIFFKNPYLNQDEINFNKKIFLISPGYFNITKNESNSDFFINHNSNLKYSNIFYSSSNKNQIKILKQNDISYGEKIAKRTYHINDINENYNINFENKFKKEYFFLNSLKKDYIRSKKYWENFFLQNNIQITSSFYKYNKDHIVISEALKNVGGISTIWQWAFEGMPFRGATLTSDIYFNFSNNLIYENISKAIYNVSVGFLMDYKFKMLKEKSKILRNSILNNGAEKIITVFDENSNNYPRWHTGHHMQKDNYLYILEELLRNNKIGVIFKPKNPSNLKERIGDVYSLLQKGIDTGRCVILDKFDKAHSDLPPSYAGLASDLAIHSHLCAGTAAVECALAGVPTILIDRECSPYNKLYELNIGNIIFQNWSETIDFISKDFSLNKIDKNYGFWPKDFLNEIDQFRDGKAAFRMGNYLKSMIDCFNKGYKRDDVMEMASKEYIKLYGKDKISFNF